MSRIETSQKLTGFLCPQCGDSLGHPRLIGRGIVAFQGCYCARCEQWYSMGLDRNECIQFIPVKE